MTSISPTQLPLSPPLPQASAATNPAREGPSFKQLMVESLQDVSRI